MDDCLALPGNVSAGGVTISPMIPRSLQTFLCHALPEHTWRYGQPNPLFAGHFLGDGERGTGFE